MDGENIYKDGDLFVIIKEINDQYINFGSFKSLEEAIEFRNDLIDCGWPIHRNSSNKTVSSITFPVSVGISPCKYRMWSIKRSYLYGMLPPSKYEKECILIVDEIPILAKLNLLTRLSYFKNASLTSYLEKLHKENIKENCNVNFNLNHGTYKWVESSDKFIEFEKSFSKDFKQGFFALPRHYSKNLFPILPYERKCNFFVDDQLVQGKFNIEARLKIKDKLIISELEELKEDNENIKIQFLI